MDDAQGRDNGLEAVDNDEEGRELWRMGALRAVLTHAVAAPCLDLEFLGRVPGKPSTGFGEAEHPR